MIHGILYTTNKTKGSCGTTDLRIVVCNHITGNSPDLRNVVCNHITGNSPDLRNVVQGGEDLVQELVSETLQLFDGHLNLLLHLRVFQSLLRRYVVR